MTFGNRQVEILAALEDAPPGDFDAADMSAQMTTSAATDRLYKAFMKHGPAGHVLRRNHLSAIADDGCQGGRAGLAGNGDGWKVGGSEVGGQSCLQRLLANFWYRSAEHPDPVWPAAASAKAGRPVMYEGIWAYLAGAAWYGCGRWHFIVMAPETSNAVRR